MASSWFHISPDFLIKQTVITSFGWMLYTGDRRDSPHSIKKLLTCVSSYVTFKILREALRTLRAGERPLSNVNPCVIHKVFLTVKLFPLSEQV